MILELATGHVASPLVDIYPEKIEPVRIKTKFNTFHRLIGKTLPNEEIVGILKRLDIDSDEVTSEDFTAIVPAYRSEVTREADLVEEVLRIHGINNIEIDDSFSTGYLADFEKFEPYKVQEKVSEFLSGKGFYEIMTNSITNSKYEEDLHLGDGDVVELLNRSSEDLGIMKPTPVFTGLESVQHNFNRKRTNLKFFEFTKSYMKREGQYFEFPKLCLYVTGNENEESWIREPFEVQFQYVQGIIQDTLLKAGVRDIRSNALAEHKVFTYGLKIKSGKKLLGSVGKLQSNITRYFNLDQPVFYAELNWENILSSITDDLRYQPMSKYPEVKRDLSLVVDKQISYREIEEISFNSEKKLLNRMNVFSVYEGERIEGGKKAYAIAFYLQDDAGTLTEKQIDKCMNRLMSAFESKVNAIIRK